MVRKLILTAGSILIMSAASNAQAGNPEDTLYIDLSTGGRVTVEMLPDRAPGHVERIKELAREGFYDGVVFHRVIEGFMAQTGDPTGTGRGGSDKPDLRDEFTDYAYKRGTVGMATSGPNTANSQFFICFTDTGCSFLTGKYTVWGQVTEGMEYVDAIARGEPPANPDKMVKVQVAADVQQSAATAPEKQPAEAAPAAEQAAAPAKESSPAPESVEPAAAAEDSAEDMEAPANVEPEAGQADPQTGSQYGSIRERSATSESAAGIE
jgi:peptidylprolyl isomerase